MNYFFKNLVFEGGGVKGIAYVGALEVLQERNILPQIKRAAGTSVGAIVAVLVGLGYTPEEIRKIMWELDFKNFLDSSWGILRDVQRLVKEYGWYKGDFFREWIGELIKRKTGKSETTFAEFAAMRNSKSSFKDIYLIGTNISTGFSEIFSAEHTPEMSIAEAARISMSIPLFFRAIRNNRKDVYVDGAVLNNYPVKVFDRTRYVRKNLVRTQYYAGINEEMKQQKRKRADYVYNKETLGFKLDGKEKLVMFRDGAELPRRNIDDFFEYTFAMINALMNVQNDRHLHSDDWQRTIYIDTFDIKAIDFGLSDDRKEDLLQSGRNYTQSYLEWYDNEEEKANK